MIGSFNSIVEYINFEVGFDTNSSQAPCIHSIRFKDGRYDRVENGRALNIYHGKG